MQISQDSPQVTQHPEKQARFDLFAATLAEQYADLFVNDPEYAYSASKCTPDSLARKMTIGLTSGRANKDGAGIKRTCKALGINYTYKAIREYLGV